MNIFVNHGMKWKNCKYPASRNENTNKFDGSVGSNIFKSQVSTKEIGSVKMVTSINMAIPASESGFCISIFIHINRATLIPKYIVLAFLFWLLLNLTDSKSIFFYT